MATLTTDRRSGKVAGYNIQWHEGKKRRTIHLGSRRFSRKTAERLKEIVERLLYYRRNGTAVPDKSTELWLQNAHEEIRAKLAKAGLLVIEEQKTCQQLWDTFMKHKTDLKPSSITGYRNCRLLFFEVFLPTDHIEQITSDRLLQWKATLLTKFAPASVTLYLTLVKSVMNWAVSHEWLPKSPMKGITSGNFVNRNNDRTITMEEFAKLLDSCPNQEWRTIIALARIGGLRCPSELQQLRWSDVHWDQNRFLVRSPKTERHAGRGERTVPLFPELLAELKKQFLIDSEFVIQSFQGTKWNLTSPFQKISRRAGLGTIVRPFDNMRMSRSNEVFRLFGSQKENAWIGHTERVMSDHYFKLMDDDFTEAAQVLAGGGGNRSSPRSISGGGVNESRPLRRQNEPVE